MEEITQQYALPHYTDQSNFDSQISKRNWIRNEILPHFHATQFQNSRKQLYNDLSRREEAYIRYETIPTHPSRQAEDAIRTLVPSTSTQRVQLQKDLHISHNLRTSQIQERMKRFSQGEKGRKQLGNSYLFLQREKEKKMLTIITRSSPKKSPSLPFRKQHLPQQMLISRLGAQNREGYQLVIKKPERKGATLRYPQAQDTLAGKTRNRRCLNQKIPLFWRNCIPLIVKNGKILHIFKEVMTQTTKNTTTI